MSRVVLVTDSSADLPAEIAENERVVVVPATFAFAAHSMPDGELPAAEFYDRMRAETQPPRPFGVPETSFRQAFEAIHGAGDEPLCIVMPFDVNPSFTTASAAMLAMDDVVDMKVVNPGVASAGLSSLLITLLDGLGRGWGRTEVLNAIDELAPLSDTIFVPENVEWLERAGRLQLIEEKLGEVEDNVPLVRLGTRITGVALAMSPMAAIEKAVITAGARAGDRPVNVTIDHAAAPEAAAQAEEVVRRRLKVARVVTTELSATMGSQLGPGAVGIGVAPALE